MGNIVMVVGLIFFFLANYLLPQITAVPDLRVVNIVIACIVVVGGLLVLLGR